MPTLQSIGNIFDGEKWDSNQCQLQELNDRVIYYRAAHLKERKGKTRCALLKATSHRVHKICFCRSVWHCYNNEHVQFLEIKLTSFTAFLGRTFNDKLQSLSRPLWDYCGISCPINVLLLIILHAFQGTQCIFILKQTPESTVSTPSTNISMPLRQRIKHLYKSRKLHVGCIYTGSQ
jgi:hypothetical protein